MQLFYNPQIDQKQKEYTFDKTESRHIVRVLRKSEGDLLSITNGKGTLFTAKICTANEKRCVVTLLNSQTKQKPWKYFLHVAIAPTKSNDRMEWFLEKATEIGIDEITPIICQHSERKTVKLDRYEKILQSAMKQSLKFQLPKLNPPISFKEFVEQNREGHKYIAHCEMQEKKMLKKEIAPGAEQTILIGPEGDFSSAEIELAKAQNYTSVTLGESRLRTETAALVACHSVAFANEV